MSQMLDMGVASLQEGVVGMAEEAKGIADLRPCLAGGWPLSCAPTDSRTSGNVDLQAAAQGLPVLLAVKRQRLEADSSG